MTDLVRTAELYQVDPVGDPRWRDLVTQSCRSSVFHTAEWLTALRHTYGYEPVAFTSSPPGETRLHGGVLFCRVNSLVTGRRLVSLPFSDHCEPLVEDPQCLREMLEAIAALGDREGRYIDLKPARDLEVPDEYMSTDQFFLHTIDLREDLNSIFRRFHKSHTQRAIRKAERTGVAVEVGSSEQLINDFYSLHRMTRRKHRAPVQPFRWFRALSEAFGDRLRIYMARIDGRCVAALLMLRHKQTLVYKYGCSNDRYKKHGATPALFWRAIVDAKESGCQEVDLGRSDIHHDGLIAFKEHLGGVGSTITYYRRIGSTAGFRTPGWLLLLQRLLTHAPESIRYRAGGLLYGHFA